MKGFKVYGHGGHIGHVTQRLRTNFRLPSPRSLHIKFDLDWSIGFRVEDL